MDENSINSTEDDKCSSDTADDDEILNAAHKTENLLPGSVDDLFDKISFRSFRATEEHELHKSGLVEPLHRIYFVGRCEVANREKVKDETLKYVDDIQKDVMDKASRLTGMMIVKKNFFCHVVEGSSDVIDEIVKCTATMVIRGIIVEAKVVSTVFEIASRYFDEWYSAVLDVARDRKQEWTWNCRLEKGEIHIIAHNVKRLKDKIFYMAQYICHLQTDEFREKMNSLIPMNILPLQEELCELYEEPHFLTVQQHLDRYLSQFVYTLTDEEEWPPVDRSEIFDYLSSIEKAVEAELEKEEKDRNEKEEIKKEVKKEESSDDEDD